jgi:hypothetical protein
VLARDPGGALDLGDDPGKLSNLRPARDAAGEPRVHDPFVDDRPTCPSRRTVTDRKSALSDRGGAVKMVPAISSSRPVAGCAHARAAFAAAAISVPARRNSGMRAASTDTPAASQSTIA